MTADPLYAALLEERFSSTWWVADRKPERAVQQALAEAIDNLARYETEEVA